MSVTCCPLEGSYDEGPSVCSTRYVVARVEHRCCECRGAIPRGATYELVKGLWDGGWSTYKTCSLCAEIRKHFACEGWIFEQLWQDLQENFFPGMRAGGPCMEGLSPEAKVRLFEARLEWLGA